MNIASNLDFNKFPFFQKISSSVLRWIRRFPEMFFKKNSIFTRPPAAAPAAAEAWKVDATSKAPRNRIYLWEHELLRTFKNSKFLKVLEKYGFKNF